MSQAQVDSDPIYIAVNSDLRNVASIFPGYTFSPRNIFAKKSNPFKPNIKSINLTQNAASEGELIIHVINSKEDFERTLNISQKVRASYLFAKGSAEINYKAEKFYSNSSIIISFKFYAEYQDIGYNYGIDDFTDEAKEKFEKNPKQFINSYGNRYIYAAKTAMYTNLILKINDISEQERSDFFLKVEGGADIKAFSGSASNEISQLLKKASTNKSYDYFSTFHGGIGIPDDANIITGALDKQDPITAIKNGLNGVLKSFRTPTGEPDPKEVGYFVGKFEDMGLNMNRIQNLWDDYKEEKRQKVAEEYYDALTIEDDVDAIINDEENPKRILLSEKQISLVNVIKNEIIPNRIKYLIDLHSKITQSVSDTVFADIDENKTAILKNVYDYIANKISNVEDRYSLDPEEVLRLIYYTEDTPVQINYYLMIEVNIDSDTHIRVLKRDSELKGFLSALKSSSSFKEAISYFPLLRGVDLKNAVLACKISNMIPQDESQYYSSDLTVLISTPVSYNLTYEWQVLHIYDSVKNVDIPILQYSGIENLDSFVNSGGNNKLYYEDDSILKFIYLGASDSPEGPLVGLLTNRSYIYTDDEIDSNPEIGISFTNILGKKINVPLMRPKLEKNLSSIETLSVPVIKNNRRYVTNGEIRSIVHDQEVWAKKNGFTKEGDYFIKRNYVYNNRVKYSNDIVYSK